MIIEGKPELGLQPHQQAAYKAVTEVFENENNASVVIPTGCGKSFISLQLITDNKDKRILFMAPTRAIQNQMYRYIAKYVVGEEPTKERPAKKIAEEHFPNLKIMLYPTLLRMKEEVMDKLEPDIIIMDELHRTGAEKWEQRIDELIEKNPEAKILGLTATPDRMDDKNVLDKLFNGKVAYELTLVDAIRRGIVKPPSYVKCDYALRDSLEGIEERIAECADEETKKALQEKYNKMRKIVERADGIPELFAKNLTKKDGKYIVFCKDKAHMDELMEQAKEWFKYIDEAPEMYSVYSGEGYSEKQNKEAIKKFEESKTKHLKLLFSVDMLNEGLHVEDISGVIMARPTESRIIYLQQLGRALSSDTTREKTIVFDLVNNYLKTNLDAEINKKGKREYVGEREESGQLENEEEYTFEADIDIFRIQGETKEFLELFGEIEKLSGISPYLINARAIKKWMEERGTTKPPAASSKDEEERKLGEALNRIRQRIIKPYLAMEEEERVKYREEYPEIDEIIEIIEEIDRNNIPISLANARAIKKWMEERKTIKIPSQYSKDEEEARLGRAYYTIKNIVEQYKEMIDEEKKVYREEHPEIDEILKIVEEIDSNKVHPNLVKARAIKKWMEERKTIKIPRMQNKKKTIPEEEARLGTAYYRIKNKVEQYKEMIDEEKKVYREEHPEIDEIVEIIEEIDRNNVPMSLVNARAIKKWMEERGTTKPPAASSKDEEEKRLGKALKNIRQDIIKPYQAMTEEKRAKYKEKHPEVDEILEIVEEIDRNNVPISLANARAIKKWMEENKTTKPPSSKSKDEEEKRLGEALIGIRQNIVKPYKAMPEKERAEYKKEHPEIDEILAIVEEIDRNNVHPYLANARGIKNWMEKNNRNIPPRAQNKKGTVPEEEAIWGERLVSIRSKVIKPYLAMTEEERAKYRMKHPEIDEILLIISEIDAKRGKKTEELDSLVEEARERMEMLKQAKELEAMYEEQLEKTKEGKTGVDNK